MPPAPPAWWAAPEGPAFVGRRSEIATLEQTWAAAVAGRRQVVFVVGEAGEGKSRLVAEVCRGFADAGAAVLLGYCLSDVPVAYEPFRPAIGSLIGAVGQVVAPDRRREVGDLLRSLVLPSDSRPAGASEYVPEHFEAVLEVLRGVAAEQPVVLVLEDLHWSTPSTLALLTWLVRRLREGRVLILATARVTPPDRSESLLTTLSELHREPGVRRLELGGLPTEDVARFVELEAQVTTDRATPIAPSLRDLTAGNPYFLQEICRDMRARGGHRGDGTPTPRVPDALRELFAARLARFTEQEREIVELAAVLGERVSVPLLNAASPHPHETLPALERAVDLGLLVPAPGEDGFRFPHALARRAVVDLIPPVRRAAHHARAAEALEARSGQSLPEIQQLAHHYRNARGTAAKAHHYLVRAAELSAHSLAYDEAARYYEQAAELSESTADRHRTTLLAADCLRGAGRFQSARDACERVAREASDPSVRLAAAIGFEKMAALLGGDVRAVEFLGDALREHGVDLQDTSCVEGLAGLARALGRIGDTVDAVRLRDVVVSAARALRDDALLAHVLHHGLWVSFGHPELAGEALEAAREVSALARTSRSYGKLGSAAFFRCLLGQRTGDRDDVEAARHDLRVAAERTGYHWFDYWSRNAEYGTRFLRGDFVGAEHVARELERLSSDWPEAEVEGHFGVQMFMVRRETGRLEAIRTLVSGTEPPADHWAPGLLALVTELGMAGPARCLLDALATEDVLEANRDTEYWPAVLAYLVEAALFLQDAATLRRLRPRLAEHTGLNLVSDQFVALCGSADRYLGMVDSALGQGDPIASFDAAEALDRRTGSDVHLASTLTSRARHLAATDGPGAHDVARTVERARAIAAPIGQVRVLRALNAIGATRTASHAAAPARRAGITHRELDVLRLLVTGATNQDIADALVISPNTAANHVRSILAKTGTTNRTQAALYAVSRGWVTPRAGTG